MQMFHWSQSEALHRHVQGDIVVMAENLESARAKAVQAFHAWARSDRSFFIIREDGSFLFEHEAEEFERKLQTFLLDIAADPDTKSDALLFEGSE